MGSVGITWTELRVRDDACNGQVISFVVRKVSIWHSRLIFDGILTWCKRYFPKVEDREAILTADDHSQLSRLDVGKVRAVLVVGDGEGL